MIGMEMESAEVAKTVFKQLLDRGIVVNRTDETVVRFLPPFIVQKKHVDHAIRQLEQVLANNTAAVATAEKRS
jgi:acetylornithine aminotransferase/acetylornithine/N-succinyldiaminopimelate aminotransferase